MERRRERAQQQQQQEQQQQQPRLPCPSAAERRLTSGGEEVLRFAMERLGVVGIVTGRHDGLAGGAQGAQLGNHFRIGGATFAFLPSGEA
jgi:hypothetical protein